MSAKSRSWIGSIGDWLPKWPARRDRRAGQIIRSEDDREVELRVPLRDNQYSCVSAPGRMMDRASRDRENQFLNQSAPELSRVNSGILAQNEGDDSDDEFHDSFEEPLHRVASQPRVVPKHSTPNAHVRELRQTRERKNDELVEQRTRNNLERDQEPRVAPARREHVPEITEPQDAKRVSRPTHMGVTAQPKQIPHRKIGSAERNPRVYEEYLEDVEEEHMDLPRDYRREYDDDYQPRRDFPCLDTRGRRLGRECRRDIAREPEPRVTRQSAYRKQRDPDKFDGEKVEWPDYFKHFETVSEWNRWSNEEKAMQLGMSLQGEALRVLGDLSSEVKEDYDALVKELTQRFNPAEREAAWRLEFRNRARKPKETIMQFGYELRRLAVKAFPKLPLLSREQWVMDQFSNGLLDDDTRMHVQFGHPKTLTEAISLAVEYETFAQSKKSKASPSKPVAGVHQVEAISGTSEMQTLCAAVSELKSDLKTLKETRQEYKPRDKKEVECFYCKQKGHYKRECPKLADKNSAGKSSNRQGN